MNRCVRRTLSSLLLIAITGCATGPFHRKVAPAPVVQPEAPELSQTPLYSPEMSEDNAHLPALPAPTAASVVAAPQPVAQKPKRTKKVKQTPSTKTASNGLKGSTGADAGAANSANGSAPQGMPGTMENATSQAPEKKQASTSVASSGAAPAVSPIGELTTGSSASAAETSHHTEDLIRTTREGLENVKRTLTAEEKTTAAEIHTFLVRAQQALKNGDVDGAFGLATKAKLLLDELTGS